MTDECKDAFGKESVMDELQALQACVDALYGLTPQERDRAMRWLGARVYEDIDKETQAAKALGEFLWATSAAA